MDGVLEMKAKRILKTLLVGAAGILIVALLLQVGWNGSYTDQDGSYGPVKTSNSWGQIYNHPVWSGCGDEMFSVWGDGVATKLTSFMSIRALSHWCGWDADRVVDGFNGLLEAANNGDFSLHQIYSKKQIAENPSLAHSRIALYKGEPGRPLAIVAAGGGYEQVVSMVEGYPYAAVLYRLGYSVAVLRYRVGDELGVTGDFDKRSEASKDLAQAIRYLDRHQESLGVTMDGYSMFGSSAGGGLITMVEFNEYARSDPSLAELPKPATVNLIYTDRYLLYKEDGSVDLQFVGADAGLSVFAIVGENDAYGGDWVLDRKVPEMKAALGDEHVLYRKCPGFPHGSGLGTGTPAEGWIDDAVAFWESNR